mmetsp:Transcript_16151/g.56379  ORF Transcript_16151/g.56379 Transcript_16151/m.56379 type:complete len:357 (+) Transcript_16151:976-2046(+)
MLNFSFIQKSHGCNSRCISCLERPTAILMPIIMLTTMFQFSWPKWTARPFRGPSNRCFLCVRRAFALKDLSLRASDFPSASPSLVAWDAGMEASVGKFLLVRVLWTLVFIKVAVFVSAESPESRLESRRAGSNLPPLLAILGPWSSSRDWEMAAGPPRSAAMELRPLSMPPSATAHQPSIRSNSAVTSSISTALGAPMLVPCLKIALFGKGVHQRSSMSSPSSEMAGAELREGAEGELRPPNVWCAEKSPCWSNTLRRLTLSRNSSNCACDTTCCPAGTVARLTVGTREGACDVTRDACIAIPTAVLLRKRSRLPSRLRVPAAAATGDRRFEEVTPVFGFRPKHCKKASSPCAADL